MCFVRKENTFPIFLCLFWIFEYFLSQINNFFLIYVVNCCFIWERPASKSLRRIAETCKMNSRIRQISRRSKFEKSCFLRIFLSKQRHLYWYFYSYDHIFQFILVRSLQFHYNVLKIAYSFKTNVTYLGNNTLGHRSILI